MKVYVVTKKVLDYTYGEDDELTTTVVGVFSKYDKAAKAAKEIGDKKTKKFEDGVTILLHGTWGEVEERELED